MRVNKWWQHSWLNYTFKPEFPNHRVVTHYWAMEEFLPDRENILGKMFIDMMLLFIVRKWLI